MSILSQYLVYLLQCKLYFVMAKSHPMTIPYTIKYRGFLSCREKKEWRGLIFMEFQHVNENMPQNSFLNKLNYMKI